MVKSKWAMTWFHLEDFTRTGQNSSFSGHPLTEHKQNTKSFMQTQINARSTISQIIPSLHEIYSTFDNNNNKQTNARHLANIALTNF